LRLQIDALTNVAYGQSVTASFSVARTPETTAQLWRAGYFADAVLYQAKRLGWNRVDV
jgi:GGDEF domain-containing protein